MHKILLFTVILVFGAFNAFPQSFEGVIELDAFTKATQDKASVNWSVKSGDYRFDFSGFKREMPYTMTFLIQNNGAKTYLLLEDANKKVFYDAKAGNPVDPLPADSKIRKTSEKKVIAGKNCYLIQIESSEGIAECWVTDELTLTLDAFPPMIRDKGIFKLLKANGISSVPLEMVSKDKAGDIVFSFSIKRITPKSLDANLFKLPADAQDGEQLLKQSLQK